MRRILPLALALSMFWLTAGQVSATINNSLPIYDTFIEENYPSRTNYTDSGLDIGDGSSGRRWAAIKFNVEDIPAGSTINSAKMTLWVSRLNFLVCGVEIRRIKDGWSQSTINWSNKPSSESTGITKTITRKGVYVEFDIKDLVNKWVNQGYSNRGLYLANSGNNSGYCSFASMEVQADGEPDIRIDYTAPLSLTLIKPTINLVIIPSSTPTPTPTPTIRLVLINPTNTPTPTPRYMITEVDVVERRVDGASLVWRTVKDIGGEWPADSWVEIYKDNQMVLEVEEDELVVNHQVEVTDLEPGQEYSYRISSKDEQGNEAVSGVDYFLTLSEESGAEPTLTAKPTKEAEPTETEQAEETGTPTEKLEEEAIEVETKETTETLKKTETGERVAKAIDQKLADFLGLTDSKEESGAKNNRFLMIMGIVVAGLVILWLILRKKKGSWIILLVVVFVVVKALPFVGVIVRDKGNKGMDEKVTKMFEDYEAYIDRGIFEMPEREVPPAVRAAKFDCKSLPIMPDKNRNYLCKNIYQAKETEIKTEAEDKERLFLYGEYVYVDCPNNNPEACFLMANFLDNWQVAKMAETLGVDRPEGIVYYFLTSTEEEMKRLCQGEGASEGMGACYMNKGGIYMVVSPIDNKYFLTTGKAYYFERYSTEDEEPITYTTKFSRPEGCYMVDNHEIIHILQEPLLKQAPYWLKEGLINIMNGEMVKQVCPPGDKVSGAVKEENGIKTEVPDFDPEKLSLEEPIESILVQNAKDDPCKMAVYMQISRDLDRGGVFYLRSLHDVFERVRVVDDKTAIGAVYEAAGKTAEAKELLESKGCRW